jgi:hypothetical protein
MINRAPENSEDPKIQKLKESLDQQGFFGMKIDSYSPLHIILPYKSTDSFDERQALTRILDSVLGNWSISTQYKDERQYLIKY